MYATDDVDACFMSHDKSLERSCIYSLKYIADALGGGWGILLFQVDGHRKYITKATGRAPVNPELCIFDICSYYKCIYQPLF